MRVMILDTETTGLDPASASLIEVGVVIYDVAIGAVVEERSELVRASDNPAFDVNGIPVPLVVEARGRDVVVGWVVELAKRHDVACVVAHNAAFDRKWLPELHHLAWVCSKEDIVWPHARKGGRLCALVADEGAAWSRWHRALSDCLAISVVLDRLRDRGVNLVALFEAALQPRTAYKVFCTFEQKDQVKALGGAWNAEARRWEIKLTDDAARDFPFALAPI